MSINDDLRAKEQEGFQIAAEGAAILKQCGATPEMVQGFAVQVFMLGFTSGVAALMNQGHESVRVALDTAVMKIAEYTK